MIAKLNKPSGAIECGILLPGSKSISNRLLIIRALCDEKFDILYLSDSEDTRVLESLLAERRSIYNTGEGGTSTRFFLALAALKQYQCVIDSGEQMRSRPVAGLVDALNQLGASIIYSENEGNLPVQLKGYKLKGAAVDLESNISSQFASALSMIAPYLQNGLNIQLRGDIVSSSYLNMTLDLMSQFGADYETTQNSVKIHSGRYSARTVIVEADWSAASYFYMMCALNPDLKIYLQRLKPESVQGDRVIASLMKDLGVSTRVDIDGIEISNSGSAVEDLNFDFLECPDLAITCIVCCAALGVGGSFSGLRTLSYKESDRIAALSVELRKIGVELLIKDADTVILEKGDRANLANSKKVSFQSSNDHRIAMALSCLAMKIPVVEIEEAECVSKSFPEYWEELKKICSVNLRL